MARNVTFSQIQPSKLAIRKAAKMGRDAAKHDGWMRPCPEDHINDDTIDNLGTLSEEHKDGWCGTVHFQLTYGDKLSDMTDAEEERISGEIGGLSHLDLGRYEGLYIPLRDAFFDAWESAMDFYPKALKAIEDHKNDK